MPDTEIQIASTTEFDSYPDYEARPRDTFTDLAEITATTEGITARFLNGCDDDIFFSCSAEVRAPWPEVLDHAPPAALLAALARRVADTEQAENYDVTRRIASLVSMTEAVPEVWKP